MKYSVEYFEQKGMSEKFARYYMSCIEQERTHPSYDATYAEWTLSKGFLYSTAKKIWSQREQLYRIFVG